jgi:hypothetical protein
MPSRAAASLWGAASQGNKPNEEGLMREKQAKRQRGAMAIETALLFPLLVLLLFGMIEFGLLVYNRQVLTNASREGARAGIVQDDPANRPTGADIGIVVDEYCGFCDGCRKRLITFGSALPLTAVEVGGTDCMGSPCCAKFAEVLEVRVTYQYEFLVLTNFGFGPIDLVARTLMKCE